MSTKILIRIAAAIMLLHSFGHTFGLLTWQDPNGDIPYDVVQKMQTVQFSFMGKDGSTMADFYSGASYCGTLLLLLIAVLLWTLSDRNDKSAIKQLWIISTAIVFLGIIELIYFFPFAVSFCVVAAVLLFFSLFKLINQCSK